MQIQEMEDWMFNLHFIAILTFCVCVLWYASTQFKHQILIHRQYIILISCIHRLKHIKLIYNKKCEPLFLQTVVYSFASLPKNYIFLVFWIDSTLLIWWQLIQLCQIIKLCNLKWSSFFGLIICPLNMQRIHHSVSL